MVPAEQYDQWTRRGSQPVSLVEFFDDSSEFANVRAVHVLAL